MVRSAAARPKQAVTLERFVTYPSWTTETLRQIMILDWLQGKLD